MTDLGTQALLESINKIKKEKNAVILAHNYQVLEVQQAADFVGDSLELAQKAATVEADIIVFCGVKFMAETAKLLNPNTKVLLSVTDAGCPMADMITGQQLIDFKANHPNSTVMCYVNSSVEVKAESDICCTSSNAVKIAKTIDDDKTILFVPDQNLGTYVKDQTNKNVICYNGYCRVHNFGISKADVDRVRSQYPDYTLLVHPESPAEVFREADVVASTKGMLVYAENHDKLVIGTEIGLYNMLKKMYPNKQMIPLSERAVCANMKKTSLRDVLKTLLDEANEIEIDEKIAKKALKSVQNMLDLS